MKRLIGCVAGLMLSCCAAIGYPIDGGDYTGIPRLDGLLLAQTGQARAYALPTGALWPLDAVQPRLVADHPAAQWQQLPSSDPVLSKRIAGLLGKDADRYAVAVLDLSSPEALRYTEHNGLDRYNPGSIGKIIIALGLFDRLARLYPDDIAARERVLRETLVTADEFSVKNTHLVPFWQPEEKRIRFRRLGVGDQASLWTYLDWMLSASSNGAASMVLRELVLLHAFGYAYPVPEEERQRYLRETPRKELSALLIKALQEPITANGFDLNQFRQGGFFTWKGKRRIPGSDSTCTARELMHFLLRLEQGQVVDLWSSRELKRLLYMTGRRIRYASSPALKDAAVYFKSGSLYSCQPEEGFICKKYQGNKRNMLNSVAIIEQEKDGVRLHYLVVVLSNVLRKNSAVAHQTLATRIHRLIESAHRPASISK